MTFSHSIVKIISPFVQGCVILFSLNVFFFSWWGRKGGRKAWGEESSLIFIPEISKLALELRKKRLGFPPLCDTASIVDVPWGASSNINYYSFHLNPFYFLCILGMNAKENYLQKYFTVQKYFAVILQFWELSLFRLPQGGNWDGVDR